MPPSSSSLRPHAHGADAKARSDVATHVELLPSCDDMEHALTHGLTLILTCTVPPLCCKHRCAACAATW